MASENRWQMRLAVSLAVIAVAAYLVVVAALYLSQRSLLYGPDRARPALGALAQLGVREVQLATADGLSLLAWYRPPPPGRAVIAYFHGNGGNLGYRTNRLRRFALEGYGVLLLEYRGYGGNPGFPSETGLYTDAAAALDFLARQGIPPERLVLYGESLGTGIAVHMAAGRSIGGLILESPFTSVAAAAQYHYPFVPAALLIRDRFDSLSQIGKIKAPVLVMWGGQDHIVPPRLAQTMFDAAPEPKERFFVPDGGHVNLDSFGALDVVIDFIAGQVG
jgi:uncharacterized protein